MNDLFTVIFLQERRACLRYSFVFFILSTMFLVTCYPTVDDKEQNALGRCSCDSLDSSTLMLNQNMRGALLGTRFKSLEELKKVVKIEYEVDSTDVDSINLPYLVRLKHCSNGVELVCVLCIGTSQEDIMKAWRGTAWNRFALLYTSPNVIRNRKDLGRANLLSRWRPQWFGEGDPAFFDIAKLMVKNINTPYAAFKHRRDSSDKGYVNSFNHITSQAFFVSCFSEYLADFIGDAHERAHHPELITGAFTQEQLNNLDDGPVDNYVDIINNGWGQVIGRKLKNKYHLHSRTNWTPELLANYLNDMQSYFSWAFSIGFDPFSPHDEVIDRFSKKINAIMQGNINIYE